MRALSVFVVLGLGLTASACGDDDANLMLDAATDNDAGGDEDASVDTDASVEEAATCEPIDELDAGLLAECEPNADDYVPGADDDWDACISDDGEYHQIESSISTVARVEAFEAIAELLWDNEDEPTPDDFFAARMLYQEEEGIDSRVVRRYDAHVEAPDGTDCALPDAVAMYPEYCVGPATLQPMLLSAFSAGAAGTAPREQAARIEAVLLWFFYLSPFKESLTCTDVAKDCDSAYAYYTGGEAARGGIGLARYVARVAPDSHEAAWDGLLAVRCWRDLDDAVPATDPELRDRARDQYDRALLSGISAILRERLLVLAELGCDGPQRVDAVFVTTLASLMDDAVRTRSSSAANRLRNALHGDTSELDVGAAIEALDETIRCP